MTQNNDAIWPISVSTELLPTTWWLSTTLLPTLFSKYL